MAKLALDIPVAQNETNADFSKPPSTMESLGASFVLGWKNSAFGMVSSKVKREIELAGDDSDVMQPDELNEKYPYMGTPFAQPTSAKKAELLAKKAREDQQLSKIANGHRESTMLEIGKFGAQLGANIIDPIGIAAGIGVGAGMTRVLAQSAIGARLTGAVGSAKRAAEVAKNAKRLKNIEMTSNTLRNMAEGVTGNLLEEALVVAPLSQEEQQDYDAYEAVAYAVGAGIAMPAVMGGMAKTFDYIKRNPENMDKAMYLAQQQAEQGKRVDLTEVERVAKQETLPKLEAELADMELRGTWKTQPEKYQELGKEIEEIKAMKPADNAETIRKANSAESDLLYRPEFERLNELDDEPIVRESEAFMEDIDTKLEETRQAFNLEDSDPLIANARKEVEDLELNDQAIKQLIACERRSA